MPPVARLGDHSDHGGVIVGPCSPTRTADGILVARLGDMHSCPIPGHGTTPIVTASATATVDDIPLARIGDKTGCGATISEGSPTWSDG